MFDNIELFLIFAGNQLGKLKVVVVVVVVVVVCVTMMTSQPLLHCRRLLQPHASRCCQGPSSFSRILDRSFVVKTRCMLWAAHCVAVAALSALEIRAIEVGERRQQRRLHPSSLDDPVEPATLSSLSSPPSAGDGSAIGRVHLKRQMLAHLIDLPLAARSACIQVTVAVC